MFCIEEDLRLLKIKLVVYYSGCPVEAEVFAVCWGGVESDGEYEGFVESVAVGVVQVSVYV